MQQAVLYNQLEASAQKQAIQDFLSFYLSHFKTNSLEVFTAFPIQYEMQQVNHDITLNKSRQPEELLSVLTTADGDMIGNILDALNQPFRDNGKLRDGSWETWYEDQQGQLKSGL